MSLSAVGGRSAEWNTTEKLGSGVNTTLGSPLPWERCRDPVLLFVDGMPLTSLTVVCA